MEAIKLLKKGSDILKEKKIDSFILDSEILLSKALRKKRYNILNNLRQIISCNEIVRYYDFVRRRSRKEPIAYIIEKKEFWSKMFFVTSDTLIPRPETELIVEQLVKKFKNKKKISILDVGTGSGCIIISLLSELTGSKGVGIDISKNAIKIARRNAEFHKIGLNLKFYKKSISQCINQKFDLIVSNPPYIMSRDIKNLTDDIKIFEPRIALDGGNDGLDLIKKVIYKTKEILKINGTLAIEIGNKQLSKVSKLLINNNFKIEQKIKDYKDNTRCIIAKNLS